jgi:hypothetical protein
MKWSETPQNMSLGSNGVDRVPSLQKNPDTTGLHKLVHSLHQFSPFCTDFHVVMKRSKTPQNLSLVSNGEDQLRSLLEIPT